MILVVCLPCALAVRILPTLEQAGEAATLVGHLSGFWPDKYSCPRCEKPARGLSESDADPRTLNVLEVKELTPFEAFAAFNGMGFPDEQDGTLEVLHELLREQPVRKLHGVNVKGSTRSVIESIELWDGTKIYLGASPEGAIVYRVTRPPRNVERIARELTP